MGLYRWCLIFSLMVFSGVNYAACLSTGPVISGHFDNAFIGYDGKVHISDAGCDYISLDPGQPIVIVTSDSPDDFGDGAGSDGDFKPTGNTSEEFKKFNNSFIQANEEFDKAHNTPQQQQERLCKSYGCDILGNLLPEEQTVKPDVKIKILDPVHPQYDEGKPYTVNAANFSEMALHFNEYKFSSLTNSYKYRDDMNKFYSKLLSVEYNLFPRPDCPGYYSGSNPVEAANQVICSRQNKAQEAFHLQHVHYGSLPEIVLYGFFSAYTLESAAYSELFQMKVDPLSVLSGQGNELGQNGKDGIDGKDGKDGIDGVPGAPGEKGDKGDKGEGVDNEELARFHHDSVVASGNIIGLLGRIHDAVVASGGSGGSGVSPGGVPDADDGSVTHPLGPSVSDEGASSGAAGDDEDGSNIFLPSLDIPELSLSPLWNMWPSARDFTLNLPDAQCPVFTIEVFGLNQRIDAFCTLLTPDVIAFLRLICILTASVFSFIIVLRS